MGYFRTKHLAASWGYDINTDCPFGLRVALGHRKADAGSSMLYRLIVHLYFDWPKLVWAHEAWAVNEPGYLQGMPVARQGVRSSAWTGREWHLYGWDWYRGWSWSFYG
jgi:hypothetical protein